MALVDHANSPQQRRIAQVIDSNPTWSYSHVARHLNLTKSVVSKTAHRLKLRQAQKEPDTHSDLAPEGYQIKGVSTQRRDAQGNIQWHKTERLPVVKDPERMSKLFKAAIASADFPIASVSEPVLGADEFYPDKLAIYPLGDPHLGLVAGRATSGSDYGLEQSVCELIQSLRTLTDNTPACGNALLISVGDLYHASDSSGATPRSKHKLDTHVVWPEVVQAVFECLIRSVDILLSKHSKVTVDLRPGNHDYEPTIFTQLALEAYYRHEPRVTVIRNVRKVQVHVYGDLMIATAHGDSPKTDRIPGYVASKYPKEWGNTIVRRCFVGHIHHNTLTRQDLTGMSVESLRVHTKPDAWTDAEGYVSEREIFADVYDTQGGRRARRFSVYLP